MKVHFCSATTEPNPWVSITIWYAATTAKTEGNHSGSFTCWEGHQLESAICPAPIHLRDPEVWKQDCSQHHLPRYTVQVTNKWLKTKVLHSKNSIFLFSLNLLNKAPGSNIKALLVYCIYPYPITNKLNIHCLYFCTLSLHQGNYYTELRSNRQNLLIK